jgi:hypothetical protein
MVLIIIGLGFVFIGVILFSKFVFRIMRLIYYLIFDIERGYNNEVVKKSPEYKAFEDNDIFKNGV